MAEKGAAVPPYGAAIHNAITRGNLAEMKRIADQADAYLKEWGDIHKALADLRHEIAKAEKRG